MKAANRKALDKWIEWQRKQKRNDEFMRNYERYMTKAIEANERQNPKYTIHPPETARCHDSTESSKTTAQVKPSADTPKPDSPPTRRAGKVRFASRYSPTGSKTATESCSSRGKTQEARRGSSLAAFWTRS